MIEMLTKRCRDSPPAESGRRLTRDGPLEGSLNAHVSAVPRVRSYPLVSSLYLLSL